MPLNFLNRTLAGAGTNDQAGQCLAGVAVLDSVILLTIKQLPPQSCNRSNFGWGYHHCAGPAKP